MLTTSSLSWKRLHVSPANFRECDGQRICDHRKILRHKVVQMSAFVYFHVKTRLKWRYVHMFVRHKVVHVRCCTGHNSVAWGLHTFEDLLKPCIPKNLTIESWHNSCNNVTKKPQNNIMTIINTMKTMIRLRRPLFFSVALRVSLDLPMFLRCLARLATSPKNVKYKNSIQDVTKDKHRPF